MKKFLLLFILFLGFPVFAQEVDVTGNCYGSTGYARMYDGTEVSYNNSSLFTFGTTYQYQLSSFQTDLHYNLQPNTWYLVTITAADNDFRNNFGIWEVYDLDNNMNQIVYGFTFVDKRKILVSFTTTTATTKVRIFLGSSNRTIPITGEVNWNINAVYLDDPYYGQSGSGGSGGSGGTTSDNQDIINNANQNTQDIINNANQNTKDIIDSNKVCTTIDKSKVILSGKSLADNGTVIDRSSGGVTDFIKISSSDTIVRVSNLSYSDSFNACFYTVNKTLISCLRETENSNYPIPDNADYIRFSININVNLPQFNVCRNGNQSLSDDLTDSTVGSDVGSGFFDNFTDNDFGLSQIITIPLSTIQQLTSTSCVTLNVPIPFTDSTVPLPCLTEIYNRFPTLFNLWRIVSFGIIAYFIAIDIFHIVKGFKDPESDKVEVLDL